MAGGPKGIRVDIRSLDNNKEGLLHRVSENILRDIMMDTSKNLQKIYGDQFEFSIGPKTITMRRIGTSGPLDMKPFFRASSKAKRKKNGGWYLVVPIQRKTKDMSNRLYKDVKNLDMGDSKVSDYLYEGRKSRKINPFNPREATRSKSITKVKQGNRVGYVSFRTVSDKSPADSWIMNRDIKRDDVMSEINDIVKRIIDWKMG